MTSPLFIVVDGIKPVAASKLDNLREQAWSYAMDRRAFGPRKLWIASANVRGRFRGLAYADRTDPPLLAVEACLAYLDEHMNRDAIAAVAFCDEPVTDGPSPPEFLERFSAARELAGSFGFHLVDWFACDDDLFRSARGTVPAVGDQPGWWDVPAEAKELRDSQNRRGASRKLFDPWASARRRGRTGSQPRRAARSRTRGQDGCFHRAEPDLAAPRALDHGSGQAMSAREDRFARRLKRQPAR